MNKPEMKPISPAELSRTYHFPNGKMALTNVVALAVSASGTHRLETGDGRKWIVPVGWMAIEIDVPEWSF